MPDSIAPSPEHLVLQRVYGHYASLMASAPASPDPNLGGKLLYAGRLDEAGRALIVASNIAGAASLCATANPAAQKQATHDGVIDFLVTSLDEALRILKNEIRKREPVAVCLAASPALVEAEMEERGVLPNLHRPGESPARLSVEPAPLDPADEEVWILWSVSSAPARWLPRLDPLALDCLSPQDTIARRWLRLSPRYLGRSAQGSRLLRTSRAFSEKFIERVKTANMPVGLNIQVTSAAHTEDFHLGPT